jgi:MinD-like ATPase involved in chromosome partitioning or flagellar assembly
VFSFALEALRPRVYTSSQLADLTGLPVVASIPALGGLSRSKAIEALAQSGGPAMESFRSMAYSFLAAGRSAGTTVMFTGIGTSGSSSFAAAQFAVALAQAGTSVVLVDAERTRQVVTNGFKASDKRGVSNAFQDGSDASSMLVDTKHDNLRILPIGTVPEAMAKSGVPERIEALVASLRHHAQTVVVSVAPTDLVADAAAFASQVDEVCLCVSARSNEYGTVPVAYDILDKAGAKTIKLILSDTSRDSEPFSAAKSIQRAG